MEVQEEVSFELLEEVITDSDPTFQSADLTEVIELLQSNNDLMQTQNDLLLAISEGSSTILVYGLIIVPLIIVCVMLWWFFKQFIYSY